MGSIIRCRFIWTLAVPNAAAFAVENADLRLLLGNVQTNLERHGIHLCAESEQAACAGCSGAIRPCGSWEFSLDERHASQVPNLSGYPSWRRATLSGLHRRSRHLDAGAEAVHRIRSRPI